MAVLTTSLVAELIRQRVGDEDASKIARYTFLIPQALKATGRKIAANPNLRYLLMTNPATVTAAVSGTGTIDLAALYTAHKILAEYFDYGQIYHTDSPYPLQRIPPERAQLSQYLANSYYFYFIQGDILTVKDVTSGNVSFAVPYYPETLSQLPESEEVQTMFLDKLFELIVGGDAASDGEK